MSEAVVYGGFWRRWMANVIDCLILLIPALALGWLIPFVGGLLLSVLYFPVLESSPLQATPGKFVMGLRVQTLSGETLTISKSLIRFFMKYVSAFVLCIGYIMQVFTARRQTLHDIVAHAVVIRKDSKESPDWFETWISHMKYLLRVEDSASSWAPRSSSSSSQKTVIESIEKLHELYKQGALTEDEFQAKKAELLKNV